MAEPLGCGMNVIVVEYGDTPERVMELAETIDAVEDDGDQEVYAVQLPDSTRWIRLSEIDLRNVMFNLR